MAFLKALLVSLAISAIWYFEEFKQFGELQTNRVCDNKAFILYFIALWYAFS